MTANSPRRVLAPLAFAAVALLFAADARAQGAFTQRSRLRPPAAADDAAALINGDCYVNSASGKLRCKS